MYSRIKENTLLCWHDGITVVMSFDFVVHLYLKSNFFQSLVSHFNITNIKRFILIHHEAHDPTPAAQSRPVQTLLTLTEHQIPPSCLRYQHTHTHDVTASGETSPITPPPASHINFSMKRLTHLWSSTESQGVSQNHDGDVKTLRVHTAANVTDETRLDVL